MLAAEGGHVEVVRVLMRNGALVDEQDKVRGFPKRKEVMDHRIGFFLLHSSFILNLHCARKKIGF